MNRYSPEVFIKKIKWKMAGLWLISFLSCWFISGLPAFAEDDFKVSAHYYLPNPEKPGRYYDAVQWGINNVGDWTSFVKKLQNLPPSGKEIDNPMHQGAPDILHFIQTNPDHISGNDIFMSKDGIQQYARMPFDVYHYQDLEMRKFLDRELDIRSSYTEPATNVKISDSGIVVVYRGSKLLKNPIWRITEPKDMDEYKKYIDSIKPLPKGQGLRTELQKTVYDDVGVFVIYPNYPGSKFDVISVTPEGGVRGTNINSRRFFYQDTKNYYETFKKQAEDIIKGNQARRQSKTMTDNSSKF